jgi:hypothetical protein
MYKEKPLTIAVMPPINQTNHVEAKDYFYTTLYAPLCEKGYYVYSPMMTMEMFQAESAYDAEMFIEGDLSQFRNVLGADAAMFTIIKSWKRNNVGGKITAGVEYILRSTKTGETLYKREGLISVLESDPRGAYEKQPGYTYGLSFGKWDIKFMVDGDILKVTDVIVIG